MITTQPTQNSKCVVCGVLYKYRIGEEWFKVKQGWICSPDCGAQQKELEEAKKRRAEEIERAKIMSKLRAEREKVERFQVGGLRIS